MLRLTSLLGLVLLLVAAWGLSNNRRLFPWRATLWGLGLQFVFALLILKTPFGAGIFRGAQTAVDQLNVYANEGARMVFGPLGDAEAMRGVFGPGGAFVFAVSISATIILISSLSSVLYHSGVLQRVDDGIAWVMKMTDIINGC